MAKAKNSRFYITRTDKQTGWVRYKEDEYSDYFAHANMRSKCPTFPKKRAKQIVERLNAQKSEFLKSIVEYGMEAVE